MCVPILRSIGTKLTNLENMQKSYGLFGVRHGGYGSNSGFHVLVTLTLTLTYVPFLSHALGMEDWNIHAKLHKNRSSING